jgi:hypothetical protein
MKSEEAMPAPKATTKIPTDDEIDQAGLDEVRKILGAALCALASGAITTKECNTISRKAGKRLKAIEQEFRTGHMAALGE